jgi:hypothetical protein
MLRLATTVVLTLIVACAIVLVELQIEIAFVPQEGGDRWFGLASWAIANTAVYAWLYAIAVGYAVSHKLRISGWRRLAAAACLLTLPPVVVDGVSSYLDGDYSLSRAFEFAVVVMAAPFAVTIFVALAGMASNKPLERARER